MSIHAFQMIIKHLCVIILFELNSMLSLLCNMKLMLITFVILLTTLSSCTSEYEERLEEARALKLELSMIEESNFISPKLELMLEISELEAEIQYLAKVSGNEELFLAELEKH